MPSVIATPFRIESRELRPVSTRIISYGSSSKIARHATLYVLRVSRGSREWYVARRYSEFRVLYEALKNTFTKRHGRRTTTAGCAHCRELARQYGAIDFPSRFPVRSSLAMAKDKIESARMQQLNAFLHVLIETTQGLLANDDDDDDDDDDQQEQDDNDLQEAEDRCDALRKVREFLMVHDHLDETRKEVNQPLETQTPTLYQNQNQTQTQTQTPSRPRLGSSGTGGGSSSTLTSSSSSSFRVHELDVLYRPTSPLSPWMNIRNTDTATAGELREQELDELFLEDYACPAEDAVVHRQADPVTAADLYGEDALMPVKPTMHVMRRTESLRMSRRL